MVWHNWAKIDQIWCGTGSTAGTGGRLGFAHGFYFVGQPFNLKTIFAKNEG